MRIRQYATIAGMLLAFTVPVFLSGCSAKDSLGSLWTMRSDESVLKDIKTKFINAGPEFLALEVRVKGQRVTLKGQMRKEQKLEAERLVWEVDGVRALLNDIEVK
jgi:osmotically-inducible protein OsmY